MFMFAMILNREPPVAANAAGDRRRLQDPVDPIAHAESPGERFQMNVGGPARQRLADDGLDQADDGRAVVGWPGMDCSRFLHRIVARPNGKILPFVSPDCREVPLPGRPPDRGRQNSPAEVFAGGESERMVDSSAVGTGMRRARPAGEGGAETRRLTVSG